jgi:hypothetical protein
MIVLSVVLAHSIYRDIQLEKQYMGDLRNRIVGARLQKDGRDPYFYKWKQEDGLRYIDRQNDDSLKVSNISSSPAFHDLLIPFCDLQQRTISIFWLWLQYLLLIMITALLTGFCQNTLQKCLLINFSVFFTCTESWKGLIASGQVYLFIAFLISLAMYGLLKDTRWRYVCIAALGTALFILVKPTALVIFLPFILLYKSFKRYLIVSFSFIMLYVLFLVINNKERGFWLSYSDYLVENVKVHQHLNPSLQQNQPLPSIKNLEGIDFQEVKRSKLDHPISINSENGNFFVIFQRVFNKKLSVPVLSAFFLATVVLLMTGFLLKKINYGVTIPQTILLAFLLYLLSDIFSPVHRHQYNGTQWLPLLLIGIVALNKWRNVAGILIIAGLLLNISNMALIPGQHTLGELCWVVGLALIIFSKTTVNNIKWQLQ